METGKQRKGGQMWEGFERKVSGIWPSTECGAGKRDGGIKESSKSSGINVGGWCLCDQKKGCQEHPDRCWQVEGVVMFEDRSHRWLEIRCWTNALERHQEARCWESHGWTNLWGWMSQRRVPGLRLVHSIVRGQAAARSVREGNREGKISRGG